MIIITRSVGYYYFCLSINAPRLEKHLVYNNKILLYIPWIRMLGFGSGRVRCAFVNKSSGFIGSWFPVGQFWFPVGYPSELCVLYVHIIYCILEPVGVGRSMRRCCSRRPVQMTGTLCEKRQCYLPRGDQERWRRRPLITNPHTHTVTRNVFFTLSKWKKRVRAWVAENFIL